MLFAAGAAASFVLGFLASRVTTARSLGEAPLGSAQDTEVDALAAKISERIEELGRRVDALALVASAPTSTERAVVPAEHPMEAALPSAVEADRDARLGRLEQGLERLVQEVDSLVHEIEAHRHVALYPSAPQLRAARTTIDWPQIRRVSDTMCRDHEEGLALVRYLTFDETLERFGAPTTISPEGGWFYERPASETLGPETFALDFVNGYVVQIHSTDE